MPPPPRKGSKSRANSVKSKENLPANEKMAQLTLENAKLKHEIERLQLALVNQQAKHLSQISEPSTPTLEPKTPELAANLKKT